MNFLSRIWLWAERVYKVYLIDRIIQGQALKQFYMVLGGHINFQNMAAAVELDLFSMLRREGPMTLDQISKKLGLEKQPCRVLLQGLTATKFLKKRGDLFSNTIISHLGLTKQEPLNLQATVLWQKHIVYKPMVHLLESFKTYSNAGLQEFPGKGNTLYERISAYPPLEKIFQDSMQEISIQANEVLARYVNFSNSKVVVDVGGGNGTNIMAIMRPHSHLQGRVFDLPTVCEKARANFAKNNLSDRLQAIPGNVFTDQFPAGADVFMFCHFMCIWSPEENISFLKKAYAQLPPGGRVIIFDIMTNDNDVGPLATAMGSPYFLGLATGTGMMYTKSEYEEFCIKAGFSRTSRVELPREHTAIIGVK